MIALVNDCGKVSFQLRLAEVAVNRKRDMSLHFRNYRCRDIPRRVVNATEVWYRRSDERRSREAGENCIDNMAIA